ncbi:MAG: polyhydroxyalkanoate synthesis regulator DNA-binding domain-containing protein [Desulfosarcinaceae bacterium]|nr:polyhydroxyalkanoate synthesis regulator DNA-binding domain-containing protein [Desulfosarcinaceae bacterium]
MDKPLIYKKYANRRIYDTSSSTYVTLETVAEKIRQGREVQVVDAKTKTDVTAFILTQIVLEQAKRNNALLPAPVLHLIIRYGDNVLMEFFESYLQQIATNYIDYKKAVDSQFKRWLDMGMGMGNGSQREGNPFSAFFSAPATKSEEEI